MVQRSLAATLMLVTIGLACANGTQPTEDPTPDEDIFANKHEDLKTCQSFALDPDEYVMFPNGTAYVEAYRRTYQNDMYVLYGDMLVICIVEVQEDSKTVTEPLNIVSRVGVAISMVCLLVHLVVFAMVRDLQNLPGFNLASLCLTLFLGYVTLNVGSMGNDPPEIVCVLTAVLSQFFFLAALTWMSVIAFDVLRSILHATGSLRVPHRGFKVKRYLCNGCVAWGTALVFVCAALAADNLEGVPPELKPMFAQKCWFTKKQALLYFFAGPIFVLVCINLFMFAISAYSIHANRMRSTEATTSHLRKSHTMYFRLAVIMGLTWVLGGIAALVHGTFLGWMWYPFVILNTFQGLFILVAFTFTGKVRKFFREKLFGGRRASEQTLTTPTFQSYCFYANSIDKDLDKVGNGDSKDKSVTIDTIVIHL